MHILRQHRHAKRDYLVRGIPSSKTSRNIVAIHGFGGNKETWAALATEVSLNDCAFIGFDLPGHGLNKLSSKTSDDFSQEFARTLRQVILEFEISRPHIIARDAGAFLFLEYIQKMMENGTNVADKFASLMLINPIIGSLESVLPAQLHRLVRFLGPNRLHSFELAAPILKFVRAMPNCSVDFLGEFFHGLKTTDRLALRLFYNQLNQTGPKIEHALESAQIDLPGKIAVINGELDIILNNPRAKRLIEKCLANKKERLKLEPTPTAFYPELEAAPEIAEIINRIIFARQDQTF
ncbi:MAG: alpha/beta hydrolase [Candidatus Micrarchaeota archaeon]